MKAIVCEKYGTPDVLKLKDVEKPNPKDNEVLIKVHAASINAADRIFLKGDNILVRLLAGGLFKPKNDIFGTDVAGRVEAVGKNVQRFKPGDEVFGDLSNHGMGALAEYVSVIEDVLALKPEGVSFEDAAAAPLAAITALQGLRDHGDIQSGQKVLVNGASGGVGSFAVQIAKSFGAEVTGVCSTGKEDMLRSLGIDHIVDYKKENFTENGESYDLIFAANGYHPLSHYKRALTPQGRCVVSGGEGGQIFQALFFGPFMSRKGGKQLSGYAAKSTTEDMEVLKKLLESGKITPVIDKCYPLHETAEAFRYIEEGHPRGKVVITLGDK